MSVENRCARQRKGCDLPCNDSLSSRFVYWPLFKLIYAFHLAIWAFPGHWMTALGATGLSYPLQPSPLRSFSRLLQVQVCVCVWERPQTDKRELSKFAVLCVWLHFDWKSALHQSRQSSTVLHKYLCRKTAIYGGHSAQFEPIWGELDARSAKIFNAEWIQSVPIST